MDDQSIKVFRELLKPEFDWKGLKDHETLVGLAQEALYLKEIPQRILGRIALQVDISSGAKLKAFSKEIGMSPNSLRIYAWVEKRLAGMDFPQDIPWTSLRYMAGTKDPGYWLKKIQEEGLGALEVKRQIMLSKGKPVKKARKHSKTVVCPTCEFEQEHNTVCNNCGGDIE